MKLTSSSGESFINPIDPEIRSALEELDLERDGEGFAILERDSTTYVQVSGDQRIGFDMEYRQGSAKEHYRAVRVDFSIDEVVRAFGEYRDGVIHWNIYGRWEKFGA